MRYRIIARMDNQETLAGFARPDSACKVCYRLPLLAYVVDTWTGQTLAENWRLP
jgi:hypothetical protein